MPQRLSKQPIAAPPMEEKPKEAPKEPVPVENLPDDAREWDDLLVAKEPIPRRKFKVGVVGGKYPAADVVATDSADAIRVYCEGLNIKPNHYRLKTVEIK